MGKTVRDSEVDAGRRAFIRSVAARTAFVAPLVASFYTAGLTFKSGEAQAHSPNMTYSVPEPSSIGLLAVGAAGVAAAVGVRKVMSKSSKDES